MKSGQMVIFSYQFGNIDTISTGYYVKLHSEKRSLSILEIINSVDDKIKGWGYGNAGYLKKEIIDYKPKASLKFFLVYNSDILPMDISDLM